MKSTQKQSPVFKFAAIFGLALVAVIIYGFIHKSMQPSEDELRIREGIEKIKAAQAEVERVRQRNQESQ